MVQRNKTEKETKTVKIKATTGAWWKSTTPEPQSEESKQVKAVEPTEKTSRRPRKPAVRKTPPKKVEQQPSDATVASGESPVPSVEKITDKPKRAPRKKPAARGGTRRSSGPKAPKPQIVQDAPALQDKKEVQDTQVEKPVQLSSTVVGKVDKTATEESVAAKDTGNEAVEPAADKPKPRRGRPRKSAKGRPKKQVSATEDGAQVDDSAKSVEDDKTTESKALVVLPEKQEVAVETEKQSTTKDKKDTAVDERQAVKKVSKLLINAEEPEECRLALLEDGRLESIHVSTVSKTQRKNNIYKAKIVAIEPSLQAAFIDYGTEKNGFLPFSEIHPEYYKQDLSDDIRHLVESHQWKKLSIRDVVERGQEVLAQVVKEEIGKKGANMTTFLSIPGRHVVLMPGSDSAGISRKISGEQRRSQLRDTMESIDLPEGIGWIVRTASVDITQTALSRDADYLLKLWEDIKERGQSLDGVGLVYEDHHSVLRFLREHFDPSFEEILVDDKTALEQVKGFISMLPKVQQDVKVRLHQGARPIFNQFSVEDQIESIYQPQVNLPSGGSIVIDPTEALVAIDVNSGSTSKGKNFEASIYQANLEAASELARQLRLRDLGGLIVVDFIDMRSKKHVLAVEKQVKAAMKKDKAKVDFTRISKFGLMQISRQKLGAPIEAGNYRRCEHCKGRGSVRSVETLSLFYLRRIQTGASRKPVERIECHFPLDVATYLLNKKRTELTDMENRYQVEITINAEAGMRPAENEIVFHKNEKEKNTQKQA